MWCVRCGNGNKFWDFPVNKYTVTIPSLYVSVNKVKVKPEHRLYDDRQIHLVTHPYLVKYSLLSVFFYSICFQVIVQIVQTSTELRVQFQLMPAIGSRHLLHNTVNSLEWHCRAVDNVLFFWSKMCLFDTFCTWVINLNVPSNISVLKQRETGLDLCTMAKYLVIHELPNDPEWLLILGIVTGSLSAWARLKYPHIFRGAVSSSAPLTALIDFTGQSLGFKFNLCFHSVFYNYLQTFFVWLFQGKIKIWIKSEVLSHLQKNIHCCTSTHYDWNIAHFA